jgi:hypothetical protein
VRQKSSPSPPNTWDPNLSDALTAHLRLLLA